MSCHIFPFRFKLHVVTDSWLGGSPLVMLQSIPVLLSDEITVHMYITKKKCFPTKSTSHPLHWMFTSSSQSFMGTALHRVDLLQSQPPMASRQSMVLIVLRHLRTIAHRVLLWQVQTTHRTMPGYRLSLNKPGCMRNGALSHICHCFLWALVLPPGPLKDSPFSCLLCIRPGSAHCSYVMCRVAGLNHRQHVWFSLFCSCL